MYPQQQQQVRYSTKGHLTRLVHQQWQEVSSPIEPVVIEVYAPNTIVFRNNQALPELRLAPSAKLILQKAFTFLLIPDGSHKDEVYGLTLAQDTDYHQFQTILDNLIGALSVRPRHEVFPQEERQINFAFPGNAGYQPNTPPFNERPLPDQRPPVYRQNFVGNEDGMDGSTNVKRKPEEKEDIMKKLTDAIKNGNVEEAKKQVEVLAEAKTKLRIHHFLEEDSDSEDVNVNLSVQVTDREDHTGGSQVDIPIDNLRDTTIENLKHQFKERHNFPISSQRWVIHGRLAEDHDNLHYCGVGKNAAQVYCYVISDDKNLKGPLGDPLYEQIPAQKQNIDSLGRNFQSMAVGGSARGVPPQGAQSIWPNQTHGDFQYTNQNPQAVNFLERNFPKNDMPALNNQQLPRVPLPRKKQDEGWSCSACTLKNPPTFPGCKVCSTPRPEGYKVPAGYIPTDEETARLEQEKLNEKLALEAEFKLKEEEAKLAQQNYLQTMTYAQKKLLPNQEDFDCPICFTNIDKGEGVMLRECLHLFCKECLTQTINTSEEPQVQCPENTNFPCPAVITDQEINELLTEEEYGKFLERGLAQAEMSTKNSFHCKSVNCKGWCIYEDDVNEFVCPLCEKKNCLTCKSIHPEMTCKQYQDDLRIRAENDDAAKKTQQMLNELVARGDAMNCPQCQVILQKKSGCDWMRCTMCKTEICWATKGSRWGPGGKGDVSGGCKCMTNGNRCTPTCGNCH